MPVKMQPTSVIKAHLGIEPNGRVQKFFTNTCYKHMDKYVPKDEGNLRTIVDIENDSITYESPYARYQYYGMRDDGTHVVKNYTTPGTGPYWDKRMVSAEMQDVVKEIQNYVNRGGK
ncbi:MAG: capsid protein [Clostridia bacterium]|nr:capsid protein [Clostridia bacterium]MBR1653736.1 capsid protein [Clostridia bacterium]